MKFKSQSIFEALGPFGDQSPRFTAIRAAHLREVGTSCIAENTWYGSSAKPRADASCFLSLVVALMT